MLRLIREIKNLTEFDKQADEGAKDTTHIMAQIEIDALFVRFSERILQIYEQHQNARDDRQLELFEDNRHPFEMGWLSQEDAEILRHDLSRFDAIFEQVMKKLKKLPNTDTEIAAGTPCLFKVR